MEIRIYRNKRNEHKYIEVHKYKCYHYSVKQYIMRGKVKNDTGDGNLHRWRVENLNELLKDYRLEARFLKKITIR